MCFHTNNFYSYFVLIENKKIQTSNRVGNGIVCLLIHPVMYNIIRTHINVERKTTAAAMCVAISAVCMNVCAQS